MVAGDSRQVVSVSLGSPRRDFDLTAVIAGERYRLRRIGTGGDLGRAAALLRELDGRVAALGLGGINAALTLDQRRYPLPQGMALSRQARRTPVVDGAGWKAHVEPAAVAALAAGGFPLAGRVAVVASVLDRPALARALADAGCRVLAGDAFYALRLPFFVPVDRFKPLAALTLPFLRRLPIGTLYPLGLRQERPGRETERFFRPVDLLAGDFHLLRGRLPVDLEGKVVLASTVTPEDTALLAARGAGWLVTATPPVAGRALAANVWEALVVAASGHSPDRLNPSDYQAVWREVGGRPRIERLN